MLNKYDGMPPITGHEDLDEFEVDLTMGEITFRPKGEVVVSSVSWASCIE